MAYPSTGDFTTWLTAEGLYNAAFSGSLAGALAAAQRELEAVVGSRPFIAAGSATARRYDVPGPRSRLTSRSGGGRLLRLDSYLSEAPVSVIVGTDVDGTDGVTLTLWTDYILLPDNWSSLGVPIDAIEFRVQHFGQAASITVNGKWGAYTTLPDDLKIALYQLAAWYLRNAIVIAATSGGLAGWKDGDIETKYASPESFFLGNGNDGSGLLGGYRASALQVIGRYSRVDL